MKTWKRAEKQVAERFGTRRTPLSGINSSITAADTQHKKLFIEVKYRQRHALHSLYESVANKAAIERKIPLIALKQANKKLVLIVVDIEDIKEVAKELKNKIWQKVQKSIMKEVAPNVVNPA